MSAELRFCVAPLTSVKVRDAAVFNQETVLYDGSYQVIKERIDPHAFDAVLSDQPMRSAAGVVPSTSGTMMNQAVATTDVDGGVGSCAPTRRGLQLAAPQASPAETNVSARSLERRGTPEPARRPLTPSLRLRT